LHNPTVYISIVECLQQSEIAQQEIVDGILDTEQTTLSGYLTDTGNVPLLKPSTVYRVSANYNIEIHNTKTGVTSNAYDQDFLFKTDDVAPAQLFPYVLGATPDMDEHFHFFQDPLKVVFNSSAVLQMYLAYGKNLRAIIRGADGVPVAQSPETVSTLTEIPASVLTPYREAIDQMIADGALPCLAGSMVFPTHGVYEAPFDLKPLMSYTFDLEPDPQDAVASGAAQTPLYRTAFTTSRYADLSDMAADIDKQIVKQKALDTVPAGLPAPGGPVISPPVFTVTDKQMEDALTAAGITHDDAKQKIGLTILWANHSGDYTPYAILIDASEPMWRTRIEAVESDPVKNAQGNVIDPAFVIYQNQPVDAMILEPDTGASRISHFIKTTAGTRTLIVFKDMPWTDTPETIGIKITQVASTFYDLPTVSHSIVNLQLSSKAPWEE
jgi:hypothetical protein